jgi:long-chain acyl-CoA synthetase
MTRTAGVMAQSMLLGTMLTDALRRYGSSPAMRWKRFGLWHPISGEELICRVEAVGRGLRAVGLMPGETAAIFAGNCCESVIADLAILQVGAVSAGFDPHSDGQELSRLVNESRARILFVEGEQRLHKAVGMQKKCPSLKQIILLRKDWSTSDSEANVASIADLESSDASRADRHPDLSADAPAAIIYSAGMTGQAKGVLLSHRTLCRQIDRASAALDLRPGDERLALMPLHHVLERVVGIYAALASGCVINFAESSETVPADLAELQPSIIQAAPRFWSNLRSRTLFAVAKATPLQRWAYNVAMALSKRSRIAKQLPLWLRCADLIADRLVRRSIRRHIGLDGARLCVSNGAAWHRDVVDWYRLLGCDIIDLYGQAETGGAVGISGLASGSGIDFFAGIEARISDKHEILLRGEELSFSYIDGRGGSPIGDRWYRSGDLGISAEGGTIAMTGRMADVILKTCGTCVNPFETEQAIKASSYIADAFLSEDVAGQICAYILIDFDHVVKYAQDQSIPFTHFRSLCQASEIRDLIGRIVSEVNGSGRPPTIDRFELIERVLDANDPAVGPAMTLRRHMLRQARPILAEAISSSD